MKLRDLERHLTAHGVRKVGEGGKHSKWRSSDGARTTAVLGTERSGQVSCGRSADSSRIPGP